MTEFKYCVYCEDEPAICFNTEAEAMEFAHEDTNMYNCVKVEKSEVNEAGETLNTEVIWIADDNHIPEEEVISDNEFDMDFPESDTTNIDISDDIDYDEIAKQYTEDSIDLFDDNKLIKEAVDALEENENEVECKVCFELGPKAEMKKLDIGYVCPKCAQELCSHQGTNLDLIDADPFDLVYDDPRDFDEPEEEEVKEEPVDANEVRKHEAGIEETLKENLGQDLINNILSKIPEDLKTKLEIETNVVDEDEQNEVIGDISFKFNLDEDIVNASKDLVKIILDNLDLSKYEYQIWNPWIKYAEGSQSIDEVVNVFTTYDVEPEDYDKYLNFSIYPRAIKESLEEHINDRPADIESNQVLQGTDNAVVDCQTDHKIIAHSKDEKPLDCLMKKPALEEPLAGEKVDTKLYENIKDDADAHRPCWSIEFIGAEQGKFFDSEEEARAAFKALRIPEDIPENTGDIVLWYLNPDKDNYDADIMLDYIRNPLNKSEEELEALGIFEALEEAKKDDELPVDPEAAKLEVHTMLNDLVADEIEAINEYEDAKQDIDKKEIEHKNDIIDTIDHIKEEEQEHIDELIDVAEEIPFENKEGNDIDIEEDTLEVMEGLADDKLKEDLNPAVGDKIRIIHLEGETDEYDGKEGTIEHIDSIGQLHGT